MGERNRLGRALGALAQLVYPRVCAACEAALDDADLGIVCGRCWARAPRLRHPQCDRCGHPRAARGDCPGCALLPPFIRSARSWCWVPHDTSSRILSALKYYGWYAVAEAMGERLARLEFPPDVVAERSALIAVPLAREKRRARGYNQADAIAAAVARRWALPHWDDVLLRTRDTPSQTRLTPGERLANVHRAFSLGAGAEERIRGRHLVLVDDVLTTGATLNACATVLFEAGARTLSYLTFGRARSGASADRL
ncbi:MAG: ComF family protein [Gemmatimonadaceae bacterium]|nr:ComF family protein [Gemmatimonadaceae bacterium]